ASDDDDVDLPRISPGARPLYDAFHPWLFLLDLSVLDRSVGVDDQRIHSPSDGIELFALITGRQISQLSRAIAKAALPDDRRPVAGVGGTDIDRSVGQTERHTNARGSLSGLQHGRFQARPGEVAYALDHRHVGSPGARATKSDISRWQAMAWPG